MSAGITQLHEPATWKAEWTIDKFYGKDKDQLEHIVSFDGKESPILKGQAEVDDYLAWLLRVSHGEMANLPLVQQPKSKCVTKPDESVKIPKNILVYGGVSCIWQCLAGNGTASAGQTLTYFNNAQAAIGVGDSTTAAAATQTDLQAASNKLRVAMNATYPQQTDGVTSAAATITFQSTFGSGQGNYSWNEVGVFNSATAATGRMLNRLVSVLGVKSAGSWSLGCAITLS